MGGRPLKKIYKRKVHFDPGKMKVQKIRFALLDSVKKIDPIPPPSEDHTSPPIEDRNFDANFEIFGSQLYPKLELFNVEHSRRMMSQHRLTAKALPSIVKKTTKKRKRIDIEIDDDDVGGEKICRLEKMLSRGEKSVEEDLSSPKPRQEKKIIIEESRSLPSCASTPSLVLPRKPGGERLN